MKVKAKGFKTVVLGAIVAIVSVSSNPEARAFVAEHLPALGGTLGVVIIILRALTTSPIFNLKKE